MDVFDAHVSGTIVERGNNGAMVNMLVAIFDGDLVRVVTADATLLLQRKHLSRIQWWLDPKPVLGHIRLVREFEAATVVDDLDIRTLSQITNENLGRSCT